MASKHAGLMTDLGLFMTRASLGLYFALAGFAKLQGEFNNSFGHFYNSAFKSMQPGWLPTWFAAPYGYALPWAEVIVGGMLLFGLLAQASAVIIFLMLLSFQIALMQMNFTEGLSPADWPGAFHPNLVFLTMAFLLVWSEAGRFSLDRVVFNHRMKSKMKKDKP